MSAWLREPHQLQEVSPKALAQLAKDYPYFAPAHYLKWIGARQDNEVLYTLQQSYPVNPVLLSLMLTAAEEQSEADAPIVPEKEPAAETGEELTTEDIVLQPASAEDYFLQQGIHVSGDLPERKEMVAVHEPIPETEEDQEKSLMVVMSFAEWLKHISSKNQKAREEEADQKALKAMWQQQKLAAAIEEESEEIPEQVFEMAVNSISRKDELVSESLAEVYAKQGKKEKAIDMYQKLSLLNPEKNAYFAAKIENLQKDL
jgi:tetratricopeptide (TPR) repeat protein